MVAKNRFKAWQQVARLRLCGLGMHERVHARLVLRCQGEILKNNIGQQPAIFVSP